MSIIFSGKGSVIACLFCIWILSLGFLNASAAPGQRSSTGGAAQEEKFEQSIATCQRLIQGQRLREAIPHARDAYEAARGIYGENDDKTLASGCNYGRLLLATGEAVSARPVLERNYQQFEQRYGKDALELIDPLMDLAHASVTAGDEAESTRYFDRAIGIAVNRKGRMSILAARLNLEAGIRLLNQQNPAGLGYVSRAHTIYQSILGEKHPSTGAAAYWVAKGHFTQQRYPQAIDSFIEALAIFDRPNQPIHPLALSSHALLVESYEHIGETQQATEHCLAIGRMLPWEPDAQQQPLYMVEPEYPPQEELNGREGEVLLKFTVDKQGFVRKPQVEKLRGSHQFSKAALSAIKRWRFAPRFEEGKAIDTPDVKYLMKFRLKDRAGG